MKSSANSTFTRVNRGVFARGRFRAVTALAALACWLGGCTASGAARYNPHAAPRGEPTLLERAEVLIDAADDALDRLDEWIENTVY